MDRGQTTCNESNNVKIMCKTFLTLGENIIQEVLFFCFFSSSFLFFHIFSIIIYILFLPNVSFVKCEKSCAGDLRCLTSMTEIRGKSQ